MDWKLSGTCFETCSCDAACPCAFKSAPTNGDCTLLVGWHINEGHFGDTRLDDLNVAMAIYSPGHMMETKWTAAVYLDERAKSAQSEALGSIFTGHAGGHPQRLASHIGKVLGVKSAPIEYKIDGRSHSLRIPNVAEATVTDLTADDGGTVSVHGRLWSIAPGYPSVVARSERLEFNDYDFHWHISGENGYHSPFEYHS